MCFLNIEYGAEEETKAEPAAPTETEDQKNQRLMIEAMQKAQLEQQKQVVEQAEQAKSAAATQQEAASDEQIDQVQNKTKITDIKVDEEFDIDDI